MLQALVSHARRLWLQLARPVDSEPGLREEFVAPSAKTYRPLQCVVLTDEVCRTLFEGFRDHRRSQRGDEEIGWVLLGIREEQEALALATLPAGAQREAGVAHVRFNSLAQAVASRIVRQWDKRLSLLGVVHTHPGSLRHPSQGDFEGDSRWVGQLRGGEGVFGIGTADEGDPLTPDPSLSTARGIGAQPESNRQTWGELSFSWYALAKGDRRYRRLPATMTLGPDLARPLSAVWRLLERHAEEIDRLCRQQNGVAFEVANGEDGPSLSMRLPLAETGTSLKVLLEQRETRFVYQEGQDLSSVDPDEERIDRAVYLVLAELAGQRSAMVRS
ncbi:MAG: Mov34/MPN/PAD-1 family protein [Gemmataceae bacterium]|nr:Mov34/MPN/PAD-1 family protein [Gemmataceae bacterium]